jgi:hypothetical protein
MRLARFKRGEIKAATTAEFLRVFDSLAMRYTLWTGVQKGL